MLPLSLPLLRFIRQKFVNQDLLAQDWASKGQACKVYRPAIFLFSLVTIGLIDGIFHTPIGIAQPAQPTRVRYIPNKKRPAPRRTEAAGTRTGCAIDRKPVEVDLLVPSIDNLPQTQSAHPTFSWYVDNAQKSEVELQFSLIEPGKVKPLYQKRLLNRQSAVMQIQLPEQVAGLEVGKQYRWTVSWGCNKKRVSEQLHQRAWIERTELTTLQMQQLDQAKSDTDRVFVYAQSGIWYESIGLAAAQKTEPKMKKYWQMLLEDGGLTQVPADTSVNNQLTVLAQ
jgi:hypothetical protein